MLAPLPRASGHGHVVRRDPFFLVGCPRSGTTLLGVLLDRHGALAVPPETNFMAEMAAGCRLGEKPISPARLARYHRLTELGLTSQEVVAHLQGHPPNLQHLQGHPLHPREALRAILELYAARQGKQHYKTPSYLHLPFLPIAGVDVLAFARLGRITGTPTDLPPSLRLLVGCPV